MNIQRVSKNVLKVSLPIETQLSGNLVQSNCPYTDEPGLSELFKNRKKFTISKQFNT